MIIINTITMQYYREESDMAIDSLARLEFSRLHQ
jgi:hypothetical protein